MRHKRLEHRFVVHIPERLEAGILYVSMEYATSAHSCCCGCGEEIVAPFTPTDWKMTFDGETISLRPSIGNWTLKCRSHYVIDRGSVKEIGSWSENQVEAERRRDRAAKARFYGQSPQVEPSTQPWPSRKKETDRCDKDRPMASTVERAFWRRVRAWISAGS